MQTQTETIFEELRADHDRHRRLMEQIAATSGDSPERRSLFEEFAADSEAHASAEERVFYNRLLADPSTRGTSAHSIEEHQTMRDGLAELRKIPMDSPGWLQKFRGVRHAFEHHMKEEEHGVFQEAGKVLSENGKERLVGEFRKVKREILAS